MRKCTCLHCALFVAFLAVLGCEGQSNRTSSASSPSTASPDNVDAAVDKVFENHDVKVEQLTLTIDDVEQRLGDAQKWTEFSIDEIGPGQYEGQAKSPKGELLRVEVRQTANGIYSRWTNVNEVGSGKALLVW